jgi:hypothetical protein
MPDNAYSIRHLGKNRLTALRATSEKLAQAVVAELTVQ